MLVNIYMILIKKHQNAWQGLWLSWQSIHFLYPQVYGSNPFIDKNVKWAYFLLTVEDENKEKRGRKWPHFMALKCKAVVPS